MSERKTTEIKLRVTPAEKAAWQLAAEDEGVGLSELIRREMNDRAAQRRPAGGAFEFISTNVGSTPEWEALEVMAEEERRAESVAFATLEAVASPPEDEAPSIAPKFCDDGYACLAPDCSCPKGNDVPTSHDESRVAKPWMFEARSGE